MKQNKGVRNPTFNILEIRTTLACMCNKPISARWKRRIFRSGLVASNDSQYEVAVRSVAVLEVSAIKSRRYQMSRY